MLFSLKDEIITLDGFIRHVKRPANMVRIRLSRLGTSKKPCYRVVVAKGERSRDGKFIEMIGTYNPKLVAKNFQIKKERYDYWVSKGAQPSKLVGDLVKRS